MTPEYSMLNQCRPNAPAECLISLGFRVAVTFRQVAKHCTSRELLRPMTAWSKQIPPWPHLAEISAFTSPCSQARHWLKDSANASEQWPHQQAHHSIPVMPYLIRTFMGPITVKGYSMLLLSEVTKGRSVVREAVEIRWLRAFSELLLSTLRGFYMKCL